MFWAILGGQHVNHRLRQMASKKTTQLYAPKNIKSVASEHGILDGWETTFISGQTDYFQVFWLLVSGKIQVVFCLPPSHSTSSRWLFQDLGKLLIVAGLAKLHLKIRKGNDPQKTPSAHLKILKATPTIIIGTCKIQTHLLFQVVSLKIGVLKKHKDWAVSENMTSSLLK